MTDSKEKKGELTLDILYTDRGKVCIMITGVR